MKTPAEIAKATVAGWVCRLASPPPDLEYLTDAFAAAIQAERDAADEDAKCWQAWVRTMNAATIWTSKPDNGSAALQETDDG